MDGIDAAIAYLKVKLPFFRDDPKFTSFYWSPNPHQQYLQRWIKRLMPNHHVCYNSCKSRKWHFEKEHSVLLTDKRRNPEIPVMVATELMINVGKSYYEGLVRILVYICHQYYNWKGVQSRLLNFLIAFAALELPVYDLLDLFNASEWAHQTEVLIDEYAPYDLEWFQSHHRLEKVTMIEKVVKYQKERRGNISAVSQSMMLNEYFGSNKSRIERLLFYNAENTAKSLITLKANSKVRHRVKKLKGFDNVSWVDLLDKLVFSISTFKETFPEMYSVLDEE